MPGQKMYRFAVKECRGPHAESVHLSQMQFCCRGEILSMQGVTATNPGGENPPEETAEKAIDGHDATIWHDLNKCPLVLTFPAPTEADAFRFITASNFPERDPVAWTMEGSRDGNFWTVLHRQERSFDTPRERRTPTAWIGFQNIPAGSASAAVRRLREGGSFELQAPRAREAFTVNEWLQSLSLQELLAGRVAGGERLALDLEGGGSSSSGCAAATAASGVEKEQHENRMLWAGDSEIRPVLSGAEESGCPALAEAAEEKEKAAVLQMLQARGVLEGLSHLLLEGAQRQVQSKKPAATSRGHSRSPS